MKLKEFKAEATIGDAVCQVEYDGTTLKIVGLTNVHAAMALLAFGQGEIPKPNELANAEKPAEKPEAPKRGRKPAEPKAETKPETQPEPAREELIDKPAGSPERGQGTNGVEQAKTAPTPEAPKTNGHTNGHTNGDAKPGWDLAGDGKGDDPEDRFNFDMPELPEELMQAKRLRDVVVFLQDRGFHTEQQIVKACERLQKRVPCLTRIEITALADRVGVAFEVLHQG
jgi:hypothetical protein